MWIDSGHFPIDWQYFKGFQHHGGFTCVDLFCKWILKEPRPSATHAQVTDPLKNCGAVRSKLTKVEKRFGVVASACGNRTSYLLPLIRQFEHYALPLRLSTVPHC